MSAARSGSRKRHARKATDDGLEAHPLAAIFPLVTGAEYEALVEDVRLHGLRQPITLFSGQILDGRNRCRACRDAGVEIRTVTFEGSEDEALDFALSLNVSRRHLSTPQRATVAVQLLPAEQKRASSRRRQAAKDKQNFAGAEGRAAEVAGRRLGISGETVRQAARIAEDAPDVFSAMQSGLVHSLPEALRLTQLCDDERAAVLQEMQKTGSRAHEALSSIRVKGQKKRRRRPPRPVEVRDPQVTLFYGRHVLDALPELRDGTVHTVITSPPYWQQRDYGSPPVVWGGGASCKHRWRKDNLCRCGAWRGSLGLEPAPAMFVEHLVAVFRAVRRVLRDDGTVWLVLGDTYRDRELVGIPWLVAHALQIDGWHIRAEAIWEKGVCLPESAPNRPARSHEQVFLLSAGESYYYDPYGSREPRQGVEVANSDPAILDGRNRRSVWRINTIPTGHDHTAPFPPALVEVMLLSSTSPYTCAKCRKPWARVVDRPPRPRLDGRRSANSRDGGLTGEHGLESTGLSHGKYDEWLRDNPPRHLGWEPACQCGSGQVTPSLVLDPFAGSGTVGLVARQNGRSFVGIDLFDQYLSLARERIGLPEETS